ncbi:tumor necrosis factor alpha-induced protein 8-like protein 1 isoform X1 [Serinus canaria]|nr:tumor necrosis factor alpha-induced protein 8-like protein 1 isoform X1 [Serinus canaria]
MAASAAPARAPAGRRFWDGGVSSVPGGGDGDGDTPSAWHRQRAGQGGSTGCGGAPRHSRSPAAFPVPAPAADSPRPCQETSFSPGGVFTQCLPPGLTPLGTHAPGQRLRLLFAPMATCEGRQPPPTFLPLSPLLFLASPGAEMDTFSTKNLALQAQKKLLSKMATKTIANAFIDDTSSEILDELYRATKEYTHNRKEAQKIIKNLIKIVMKLGVLYRNGQFSPEELLVMERFRKKVHTLAMTAVSFHQIDFTFDRRVMSGVLTECRDLLHQAVNGHLTAKSHSRINHVFNHFADYEFLSALYGPAEPYRTHLQRICEGLNKMLEEESI